MHEAQEKCKKHKRVLDVNMCILPDELVEEILTWTLQEVLPKLSLVSKSWKTLIDSLEFKHLRSLRSGTRFVFQDASSCKIYAAACLDSPEKMKATTTELGNHPFPSSRTEFSGSCNGMICRLNSSLGPLNFVLWNPSTNQHLELPGSPPIASELYPRIYYGFGYDAARDDYKVVTLVEFDDNQVEHLVYSLKSNSWKKLPNCPYIISYSFSLFSKGVFANNALHWLMCRKRKYYEKAILALDLTTEKFHLVPLPQLEKIGMIMKLHALDGCLCLMVLKDYELTGRTDMWTMMKYGAENSWTKLIVLLSGEKLGGIGATKVWYSIKLKPIMYSRGSGNAYMVF